MVLRSKSKAMTVKEATLQAFNEMPEEFHILQLCRKVKNITHRPNLMDGTITRKLRELREDGQITYEVSDRSKSFYLKNFQLQLAI